MECELCAYLFPVVTLTLPPLVGAANPPAPCSGLHAPSGQQTSISLCTEWGFGALRLRSEWPPPWKCPHKTASLSLGTGPGPQVQPGEGSQRLGEVEDELRIQQTATLFWGVVLGPGRASMLLVLLPSPWKTSGDASVYFCFQALVQEKGSLTWGEENIWSNLASKYLNSC